MADTLYVYWQERESQEPVLVDTVEYPEGRPADLEWYPPEPGSSMEDVGPAEWTRRGGIYHYRWNDDEPVTVESLQAATAEQEAANP